MKIAVFAGDGIGPEVTEQAVRVLQALGLPGLELVEGDVGGMAYRKHGHPLPPETLETARASDAILFGAVGDFDCDNLERHLRPEQAILGLRKELGLFANLRPAKVFAGLEDFSALRPEVAGAIDLALDPFPYNGAATTCDALWMGVPVLTLNGTDYRGRQGASILTNLGLAEFVADSPDKLVGLAASWADQRAGLADLRGSLRDMLDDCPLTDSAKYVGHLEAAYREVWRKRVAAG